MRRLQNLLLLLLAQLVEEVVAVVQRLHLRLLQPLLLLAQLHLVALRVVAVVLQRLHLLLRLLQHLLLLARLVVAALGLEPVRQRPLRQVYWVLVLEAHQVQQRLVRHLVEVAMNLEEPLLQFHRYSTEAELLLE